MLIVAVVTQFVNGYIRSLSIALQAIACDLVGAHIQARLLVDTMGDTRKNCNEPFHRLFERTSSIASENDKTVTTPRTSGPQRHTANASAETIKENFRINVYNPVIDYVISDLKTPDFYRKLNPCSLAFT